MKKLRNSLLASTISVAFMHSQAFAQIVRDGTAGGAAGALTGPNFVIDGADGLASGSNLFHSFSDFQISAGETATFTDTTAGGFANVIARVTGASATTIDGLLAVDGSTLPGADFFFINPHGVTFNENASVDVPAGFYVSTADVLNFDNGDSLKSDGGAGSTFSVATPEAFGFLGGGAGDIAIQSNTALSFSDTFALLGGDINVTDSNITVVQGDVHLRSANGAGEFTLDPFAGADSVLAFGDITFVGAPAEGLGVKGENYTTQAPGDVFVQADNFLLNELSLSTATFGDGLGGDIFVNANNTTLTGRGGSISAFTEGAGNAGDITIVAGDLLVTEIAAISAASDPIATGDAGDVTITATNVALTNSGIITNGSGGPGSGGEIVLTIANQFFASGASASDPRPSEVNAGAGAAGTNGAGGSITITAAEFIAEHNSTIAVNSDSLAEGGDLTIIADTIRIAGANVNSISGGPADSGDITIAFTSSLELDRSGLSGGSAAITSRSDGAGDSGDIHINGTGDIMLIGSNNIESSTTSSGNAGNISIATNGSLLLQDGAGIDSNTNGAGAGGAITIDIDGDVRLEHASVINAVTGGAGDAGRINIDAASVTVLDGSQIQSITDAVGDGGFININAPTMLVDGFIHPTPDSITTSGIIATAFGNATGEAGDIVITVDDLVVSNNGIIDSSTNGAENAGDISVDANTIRLLSGGRVTSRTAESAGAAGAITINATEIIRVLDGASISTTSTESSLDAGDAGAIAISSPTIILSEGDSENPSGGNIQSASFRPGDAGMITINDVINLSVLDQSRIFTSSSAGAGGDITINFSGSKLEIRDDGAIETAVLAGDGKAGDININGPSFVILEDADIQTFADTGSGGAINIDAGVIVPNFGVLEIVENRMRVFSDPISFLDPSSTAGASGAVALGGLEGDVSAGVDALDESFLDASDVLGNQCAAVRAAGAPSSFVLTDDGELVRWPTDIAPALYDSDQETGASALSSIRNSNCVAMAH